MPRLLRILFGLVALTAFGGLLFGDDPKKPDDKKDPVVKVNHQLPQNYGKLGLSDEQKKKIYAVQDDYGTQIAELEAKVKKLREEEKTKIHDVLTVEQKKKLVELIEKKVGGDEKKP